MFHAHQAEFAELGWMSAFEGSRMKTVQWRWILPPVLLAGLVALLFALRVRLGC